MSNYSDDERIPKMLDYALNRWHYHLTKRLGANATMSAEEFTEEFTQVKEMTDILFGKSVLVPVIHLDAMEED